MEQEQIDKLNRDMKPIVTKLNQVFQEIVAEEIGISPNYRYFQDKKKNRYFWTTEPVIENGKKRFVSGVYRYFKKDQCWRARKRVLHAKRKAAKARAERLYEQATKEKEK